MPTLQSALRESFKIPPPEIRAELDARARAWEREERQRVRVAKLRTANVPPEYQDASLDQCLPAIRDWCRAIEAGSRRNLILRGEVGTGKTFAGCAILNHFVDTCTCKLIREAEIITRLRAALSGKDSESEIIAAYSSPRILVLDDFGKFQARDWSLPALWEIIDNRYTWGRPTVFTTQLDSGQLALRLRTDNDPGYTADSIIDRMRDSQVVVYKGKSRRGHRA